MIFARNCWFQRPVVSEDVLWVVKEYNKKINQENIEARQVTVKANCLTNRRLIN